MFFAVGPVAPGPQPGAPEPPGGRPCGAENGENFKNFPEGCVGGGYQPTGVLVGGVPTHL